jgi:hypothetical protein
MVAAALRRAFIQPPPPSISKVDGTPPDRNSASQTLRHIADQRRGKWPKLGRFIDVTDSTVDFASFRPVGRSAVEVRFFHLATVFWLIP